MVGNASSRWVRDEQARRASDNRHRFAEHRYEQAYDRLEEHAIRISRGGAAGDIGIVSSNSWDIFMAPERPLRTFWLQRRPEEPEEELGFPASRFVTALTDLHLKVISVR